MFSGKRSFELEDKGRNLICDTAIFPEIGSIMQIKHRPNMKKAGSSVPVIAYLEAKWPHDRIETRYIGWKLGRADGSIFNEGNRLGRSFPAGKKRKTSLANGP